jgi:hypothetical protein
MPYLGGGGQEGPVVGFKRLPYFSLLFLYGGSMTALLESTRVMIRGLLLNRIF